MLRPTPVTVAILDVVVVGTIMGKLYEILLIVNNNITCNNIVFVSVIISRLLNIILLQLTNKICFFSTCNVKLEIATVYNVVFVVVY